MRNCWIVIVTLLSATNFISIIVLGASSAYAETGPHVNRFNSFGMWVDIVIILFCYIFPLILFLVGIHWTKYIMIVFNIIGMFILLAIFCLSNVIYFLTNAEASFQITIIWLCGLGILLNLLWFFLIFKRKNLHDS